MIKTLSLRQPWLFAILELKKSVENRRWSTKYRGPVLLHAAKGCTVQECADAVDWMTERKLLGWFKDPRWPGLEKLERGGICGIADIVDVIPAGSLPTMSAIIAREHGADVRWWMEEQHGFILKNVRRLPFIPMRGSLGLRDAPADIARAVDGILRGVCACGSEIDDPGPTHLPSCAFADPNHDGGF